MTEDAKNIRRRIEMSKRRGFFKKKAVLISLASLLAIAIACIAFFTIAPPSGATLAPPEMKPISHTSTPALTVNNQLNPPSASGPYADSGFHPAAQFTAMSFLSDTTGFVVSNSQLLRTTDGGRTWTPVNGSVSVAGFTQLDFVNARVGWALKEDSLNNSNANSYSVMRTTDGGKNWTQVYAATPPSGDQPPYNRGDGQMQCLDADNAYIVMDGELRKTTDGGQTWNAITPPSLKRPPGVVPSPYFYFLNANDGFAAVSFGGTTVVYHTTDGGQNWTNLWSITGDDANQLSGACFGVTFYNDSVGWLLLSGQDYTAGYIYRTTDGGKTFTQISGISTGRPMPRKLLLTGEDTGWIATDQGAGPVAFGLEYTSDGGKTFTQNIVGNNCDDIAFTSPDVGFAYGWTMGAGSFLVGTTDGGKTWSPIYPVTPTAYVSFADANNGFGLGAPYDAGTLMGTTDGGKSWRVRCSLTRGNLQDGDYSCPNMIHFISNTTGYAYWSDGVQIIGDLMKTTDGGKTWAVSRDSETLPMGPYQGATETFTIKSPAGNGVVFDTIPGNPTSTMSIRQIVNGAEGESVATFPGAAGCAAAIYGNAVIAVVSCYTGSESYGCLIVSHDSGATWEQVPLTASTSSVITNLPTIDLIDENNGFIFIPGVGMLCTADSGENWQWR